MAIASHEKPAQTCVSTFFDNVSLTAASMSSDFPQQVPFHSSTCKRAASMASFALPFKTMDCSSLETDDVYDFENMSPPLLLQHTLVPSIGAGLANLGNTCFLNSVLQCLTYTAPLAAHLRAGLHSMSCNMKGFCAMCAMEKQVRDALSSRGRIVSPSYLVKNLRSISRSFQPWRQEDSHEYMRYLIEALQRCCCSVELLSGGSFIRSVLGGCLRSQVKCTQCSYRSNKYDPFLDLSLEVNRADSLNKALEHFTAIEVLDGDNKYHCSKCKIKVRALKQFTIDKAPPILTVQFKRFSNSGSCGGKIDKMVKFERDLDLTPFVTGGEGEKLNYSLYAVLVHFGWSTHSGHYYCFVRTATDTWHAMDDSEVSQVSESTVLMQKAYILFYVRNMGTPISSETNVLNENFANSTSSPQKIDHGQKSSESSKIPENNSGSHPHSSKEVGFLCVAEQVAAGLKLHDDSKCVSRRESQEKLPFSDCLEGAEGKVSHSSPETAISSKDIAEDMNAENLNDVFEESWYRAVQIINNPSIDFMSCVKTDAGEFDCSMPVAEAQEEICAREQSVCTGDSCGDDLQSTSPNADGGTSAGADSEVRLNPKSCQGRQHSVFDFVSPIFRTARFGAEGHHALSALCMCAKYYFWSCFWPPV